jgi:hypothetical protein
LILICIGIQGFTAADFYTSLLQTLYPVGLFLFVVLWASWAERLAERKFRTAKCVGNIFGTYGLRRCIKSISHAADVRIHMLNLDKFEGTFLNLFDELFQYS